MAENGNIDTETQFMEEASEEEIEMANSQPLPEAMLQEEREKGKKTLGYKRPPVPKGFNESHGLTLMQIDIDYYSGRPLWAKEDYPNKGILRMYGITENQNSVLLHIHNFEPYFYVKAPADLTLTPEIIEEMR